MLDHKALWRAALLLLVGLALLAGCDMYNKPKASVTGSTKDPLVRERVLRRVREIYAPGKRASSELQDLLARKECRGVCPRSGIICDASRRICDLTAEYPKGDEEMQENCQWSSTDCDSARVACAGCGGPEETESDEDY